MKKVLILGIIILTNAANAGVFNRDKNKLGCTISIERLQTALEQNLLARTYTVGVLDQYILTLKNEIKNMESDAFSKRLKASLIHDYKDKLNDTEAKLDNEKIEAREMLEKIKNQSRAIYVECYEKKEASSSLDTLIILPNPLEK